MLLPSPVWSYFSCRDAVYLRRVLLFVLEEPKQTKNFTAVENRVSWTSLTLWTSLGDHKHNHNYFIMISLTRNHIRVKRMVKTWGNRRNLFIKVNSFRTGSHTCYKATFKRHLNLFLFKRGNVRFQQRRWEKFESGGFGFSR